MKPVRLTSESFGRVITLCDAPNVVIRVCGRDFHINQPILPFISTELEKHFATSSEYFIVSLNDGDLFNSLFEGVTPTLLIESCSVFVSLIHNGSYPSNAKSENSIQIPSLLLFAKKIFSTDLLSSIIRLCSSPNESSLTFERSNCVWNLFSKHNVEEFSFKVCSKMYNCSPFAAAILSKKAFHALKNENHFSIEVQCPNHIQRSKFEGTIESVFKLLFGFPLSVSNENFEVLFSISSQIGNSVILNSIAEFLQSNDSSKNETMLTILRCSEFISEHFKVDSIVSKIAQNFETLSFGSLSKIPPFGISEILKNEHFQIQSEDSLFDFLLKYFDVLGERSLSLIENVHFEYLNRNNLKAFFELFSHFEIPPSVIQFLSFIFKFTNRFVHPNRDPSQSISTSIHYLSLSQIQNEIETFQKQRNNQQLRNNIASSSASSQIELFKHLRRQCNDQNPHKARLVNLTASSIYYSNDSCNIFEYSRINCWSSKYEPNQWHLFDLKGISFKIEKIFFNVHNGSIPRHWRLLGSNDNQTWISIHDQRKDERCTPFIDFLVDYDIYSTDFFTFFKFEQLDKTDNGFYFCSFWSVEFIGRLNDK
jgi:hypothetical protein